LLFFNRYVSTERRKPVGAENQFLGGRIRISSEFANAAAVAVLPLQQVMAGADDNRILPTGFLDVSTIPPQPASQDQNPYGLAFVPDGFPSGGKLSPGDILVSNFNDPSNTQGTGTTITKVAPDGETSTFFQGTFASPTDGGLTTALGRFAAVNDDDNTIIVLTLNSGRFHADR
jgi:hypothetical protein